MDIDFFMMALSLGFRMLKSDRLKPDFKVLSTSPFNSSKWLVSSKIYFLLILSTMKEDLSAQSTAS